MNDHGLVTKLDERLGKGKGLENRIQLVNVARYAYLEAARFELRAGTYERTQASAEAADEDEAWGGEVSSAIVTRSILSNVASMSG